MKANNLGAALASFFSSLFPKAADIELRVDTSKDSDLLYFEPQVEYQGLTYRFADLGKIPSRIKIGPRHFRISQKNRQTLRKLSEWDPTFDPQKGFVFHEKDVPDVLGYPRNPHLAVFTFGPAFRACSSLVTAFLIDPTND